MADNKDPSVAEPSIELVLDLNKSSTPNNDNTEAGAQDEVRNVKPIAFVQTIGCVICLILLLLFLLAACIALAVALGVVLRRSTTTAPSTGSTTVTSISSTNKTNTTICGIQDIAPNPTITRIVGGTQVVPHSWPWMIYYEEQGDCTNTSCPIYNCAGVLIDPIYVLIAAKCLHDIIGSYMGIIAGLDNLTSVTEDAILQLRTVSAIFIYPTYNDQPNQDDIAVLKLNAPIELNSYVQIACLPNVRPQVNQTAIIAGWGAQVYGDNQSTVLNQAFTQVISNCSGWWSSSSIVNDTTQICVANRGTGSSLCTNDIGGPLLTKNSDQWVVSGIASFIDTSNCNTTSGLPNVYTNVAYYLSWINNIINVAITDP